MGGGHDGALILPLAMNTHIQPKNSLEQRSFQLLIFFIIYNVSYGFIH